MWPFVWPSEHTAWPAVSTGGFPPHLPLTRPLLGHRDVAGRVQVSQNKISHSNQ